MANPPESPPKYSLSNCFKGLTDHKEKRKDPDVRNVLLVVATLIAAVTFQAGVNPPGGVWQDNKEGHKAGTTINASDETTVTFAPGVNPPGGVWQADEDGHKAGTAIYASDETAFLVFLLSNTLALSSSVFIIIWQTWDFPFFIEVLLATVSMLFTYGASVFAVTPKEEASLENDGKQRLQKRFRYSLWIAVVPIVVRVVVQIYKYDKWKQSGGQRKNDRGMVQRDNDG